MKFNNINNFHRGWIVGNFVPSLIPNTDMDIGLLVCEKDHIADGHYHKLHTEHNIIVSGKALINDSVYTDGDIFIYEPYDRSIVRYLETTTLLVIKHPSVKGDKYE
jgi:hypothetical protein